MLRKGDSNLYVQLKQRFHAKDFIKLRGIGLREAADEEDEDDVENMQSTAGRSGNLCVASVEDNLEKRSRKAKSLGLEEKKQGSFREGYHEGEASGQHVHNRFNALN